MERRQLRDILRRKKRLRKALVLLGLNLCASLYISLGVYGSLVEITPSIVQYQSAWSALGFGAAALLLIRGIYYFGTEWDRIIAREGDPKGAAAGGA